MGTIASTYNGGLTSLTLHEFNILMTLPIGTSGYNIIYTSEYIPKLQIHQHRMRKPKTPNINFPKVLVAHFNIIFWLSFCFSALTQENIEEIY